MMPKALKFLDNEGNITFLLLNDITYEELVDKCLEYYVETKERDTIDQMCLIEWGIQYGYLTILTDEEGEEIEKQNNQDGEERQNS